MIKFTKLLIFLFFIVCLFFTGCENQKLLSLKQQDLFTLNYGTFEDELNMLSLSENADIHSYLYMQDGFFYISNSEAKKVMQFTSYGDIIGVFYNKDYNPTPSFESAKSSDLQVQKSTQQALNYPFNKIGKIVSDNKKNWYVVDHLPIERQEFDAENELDLKQVILRFSEDGKFIDYLGQQGPGGTPFSFVKDIYTNANNELIVVCLSNYGLITYWFSEAGFLKYTIPIKTEDLLSLVPLPKEDLFVSLDTVIPDRVSQRLYLKADYQRTSYDVSTKAVAGIEYLATYLFTLEIDRAQYDEGMIISPFEYNISDGFSKITYSVPYDFLGVSENGWLFFIIAEENGFMVQMVQENGQRILKRHIPMDFETVLYHDFALSSEGIISGLLIEKEKAKVAWWRTDTLIESLLK